MAQVTLTISIDPEFQRKLAEAVAAMAALRAAIDRRDFVRRIG